MVYERQHGLSIYPPYLRITVEMCCCHFVSRAQGGLGEEWNIFGCYQAPWLDEHKIFDRQIKGDWETYKEIARQHFIDNYEDWSEDKCKYQKYKEIKVRRKNENTDW